MIPDSVALLQYKITGASTNQAFDDARDPGVVNWPIQFQLNADHPISKIDIHHGGIVDSLAITYQLTTGDLVERRHGGKGGSLSTVTIKPNEALIAISGRTGLHPYYHLDYLFEISFIIFDVVTQETRVEGPFGNGSKITTGTVFYVPRPVAFAGYIQSNEPKRIGVASLSAYTLTEG